MELVVMAPRTRNLALVALVLGLLAFMKFMQVHYPASEGEDYSRQIDIQIKQDTGQMGVQK